MAISNKYNIEFMVKNIFGMQSPEELKFIWQVLEKTNAKKVLEIGTGSGSTTTMLALFGADVVTIDNRPCRITRSGDVHYWNKFPETDKKIKFHLADSNDAKTAEMVKDKYDVVLIDGGHDDKTGFRDWDLYSPMATKAIMIHDICDYENKHGKSPCNHTWDWFPTNFWWSVKSSGKYKTDEIIDLPAGGWGVIWLT